MWVDKNVNDDNAQDDVAYFIRKVAKEILYLNDDNEEEDEVITS